MDRFPGTLLTPEFFLAHPARVAPLLVGKILTRITPGGPVSVRIVETEAYGADDPASHSFRGESPRNRSMFLSGGCLYVYLIYGIHQCVNIVTQPAGTGSAVLLRAGEPLSGWEQMFAARFPGIAHPGKMTTLTSGPGNLCRALGIDRLKHDGLVLNSGDIFLWDDGFSVSPANLGQSRRTGITKGAETPWRWFLKENPFVSGKRA